MPVRWTDRLAELQSQDWESESSEEALQQIAEFGATNIHVLADEHSMSWTYSTGMYDTWGQPEILMTGYPSGLAASILNTIADRNRAGQFLTPEQREPDLIQQYDCIFRPVENVWVQRLMLRSNWFYGEVPFPVLQCICPDFENRFPWEPNYDPEWRARQALLFAGVERTDAEKKLWNVSGFTLAN